MMNIIIVLINEIQIITRCDISGSVAEVEIRSGFWGTDPRQSKFPGLNCSVI